MSGNNDNNSNNKFKSIHNKYVKLKKSPFHSGLLQQHRRCLKPTSHTGRPRSWGRECHPPCCHSVMAAQRWLGDDCLYRLCLLEGVGRVSGRDGRVEGCLERDGSGRVCGRGERVDEYLKVVGGGDSVHGRSQLRWNRLVACVREGGNGGRVCRVCGRG